MPKFDHDAYVLSHLGRRNEWDMWHRKCHTMLRVVTGDVDALMGASGNALADEHRAVGTKREHMEIYIQHLLEGAKNYPLLHLSTLVKQVAFRSPSVHMAGLGAESQWLHHEYLRKRLNRNSSAAMQGMMALWCYLVTGVGILGVEFRDGVPAIVHRNPIDVMYDRDAETVDQIRWIAVKSREPWQYWHQQFGKKFADKVPEREGLVELQFFWDKGPYGASARQYVLHEMNIIETAANPFTKVEDTEEVPMLPYSVRTMWHLPWSSFPTGGVEMMLPHCIAAWRANAQIDDALSQSSQTRVVNVENLQEDQVQKLKSGDRVSTLFAQTAPGNVMATFGGFTVPADVYGYLASNEAACQSMSGADPYATGSTAPNTSFATEAQAINQRAGLTRDTTLQDYVSLFGEAITIFLHACKKYDTKPVVLRREDGTALEFSMTSKFGPIGLHLRPDATPVIRPDTTAYKSAAQEKQEIAEAMQLLAPYFGQYPEMMNQMLRRFLGVMGEDDLDRLLTQPLMQAQAANQETEQAARA